MITMNLENKTILITGGSSGIGRSTAIACAQAGAKVIILGRNENNLKKTINDMNGKGHIFKVFDFNVCHDYETLFREIVSEVGKLDGMVHSAGVSAVIPLRVLSREKMMEVMTINYFSFIGLVKEFSKKKYSNGGSVVGVSSVVVERGEQCQTIYSASKAAMEASVKCLAIELGSKNIRINTVMPGMIRTEMMDRVLENGSREDVLGAASVLGIGKPEQVASSIVFLLSDLSSYTTGRTIYVDGGCLL